MSSSPVFLPEVKVDWQNKLQSLRDANQSVQKRIGQLKEEGAADSSSQMKQAEFDELQAAMDYNRFIEGNNQFIKFALAAEERLKRTDLTLLERHQLETTRDNMYSLSAEFIQFRSENEAGLLLLEPVDLGAKKYYIDGRVEWNDTAGGLVGQLWDGFKEMTTGAKEALMQGPFTTEQNYLICQSAMAGLLPALAGKTLVAPGGGGPGQILWGEAVGESVNAADPAGQMCRVIYPRGMTPQEIQRLGQVIEVFDPLAGDLSVVLIAPEKLAEAALLDAFGDPQVQALWSSEQAAQAFQGATGSYGLPFLDVPDSLHGFSALAPIWENPEWGIQLASLDDGSVNDAGAGLFTWDSGTGIYSLVDGKLKVRQGEDGAGVLLGSDAQSAINFDAGTHITVTGTSVELSNDEQTITRNWLTDTVFETSHYGMSGGQASNSLYTGFASYDLFDQYQRNQAEYQLSRLYYSGQLDNNYWNQFTQESSAWMLGSGSFIVSYDLVPGSGGSGWGVDWTNPIGAFYDSQSEAHDAAASIAVHLPVALDAQGGALSAQQLELSAAEAQGLRLWRDLNEGGRSDAAAKLAACRRAISRFRQSRLNRKSMSCWRKPRLPRMFLHLHSLMLR